MVLVVDFMYLCSSWNAEHFAIHIKSSIAKDKFSAYLSYSFDQNTKVTTNILQHSLYTDYWSTKGALVSHWINNWTSGPGVSHCSVALEPEMFMLHFIVGRVLPPCQWLVVLFCEVLPSDHNSCHSDNNITIHYGSKYECRHDDHHIKTDTIVTIRSRQRPTQQFKYMWSGVQMFPHWLKYNENNSKAFKMNSQKLRHVLYM